MFHQVRVDPKDCKALRFLWLPDADFTKPPEEYQTQVHLFGATSSPSCSSYALKKTAHYHEAERWVFYGMSKPTHCVFVLQK
jgi:hypothetical protein